MSCLQEWLSQVRFTMIDLISDYGGNELFVIDGDALIFFFANNHFNIDKPSSLLELVYLIEKFLDDLITRKASFVIAFFDCNENALTLNSPKRKFYRNAIKNHFSTTEIEVISFPSWLDDSWLYYVKEIHPVFIMVVSGDLESGSSIDNWKAFAHSSLSRGLNCALLSTDFYFKDSNVMGYIFSNDTNQDLDSIVSEYAKCPEKVLDSFQQSAEDDNQKSPLINAFKRNTNLSKNTLAASLILTRCILPEMSLNNLCFKTSYVPTTQILEYLNEYYFAVDPFNKINDIDINERLFIHIVNNFPDLELLDSSITLAFYKIVDLFKVIVPAYKPTSKVIKTDFDKQDINLGSFQNPCFDGYFSEAFISTLSKPTTSLVEAPKFLEVVHWHSPKKLDVDEKLQTKWELKSNQFYIRFVNQYAQSLVGVKGLFGNTIILKDKKIKEVKSKIGSKAQAIIAQNNIKSNLQNIAKLKKKFDFLCSKLKGQSIESSLSSVDQWLSDVESSDEIADIFYCKARWLKLKVLVENWDANTSIDVIVLMIVEIKAIFEKFRSFLVASDLSILKSIFGLLGFSTEIFSITPISNEKSSQLTSIVLPRSSTNLNLGISFLDFQMKYMSRELSNDRLSLPVTDSRVPFKPDAWQVELLDIVDKRESALICAPTSSGKTFIAYYAMKQILEYSDTDIIVFVAPTKALVNQVAAEVYARYKKTYKNPGMQSWGILTRDYRHNAMNCQILVTVPEMLRILLFSPLNISWAKRIKRVIFDEIHCIGQEGGAIWENLLLAIQVPVLCLSATVGNPTHFYSWLQKAQGRIGIPVHLIQYEHRTADLRKFVFNPEMIGDKIFLKESGGITKDSLFENVQSSFIRIHPWSTLTVSIINRRGVPRDAKLSSDECLVVFEAISMFTDGSKIAPSMFIDHQKKFIDKKDVAEYESVLREFLRVSDSELLSKILETLKKPLSKAFENNDSISPRNGFENSEHIKVSIIQSMMKLAESKMLPAIVFLFDRNGCESGARIISEYLEQCETKSREKDLSYIQKKEEAIKKSLAPKNQQKKKGKKNDEDDDGENDIDDETIFDWEAVDLKFSFINPKNRFSKKEIKETIKSFKDKLTGNRAFLVKALERGIGVHHAGLPRKYLAAVESLMRGGYLQIVFGTGTLALGINMPCRTTVFLTDSIFLTPLQFRQMSGRSGRRGFDSIGNVVFLMIPQFKVARLLMSALPDLSGHFPLNSSLVLRSLLYLTQCSKEKEDEKFAKSVVSGLVSESLFCLGQEHLTKTVSHHLRISVAFLQQLGMIDQFGNLIDLAGIALHLFWSEPSNFLLAYLLREGVFHNICKNADKEQVMLDIIHLMAHLFERVDVPQVSQSKDGSTINITLKPLESNIQEKMQIFDDLAFDVYVKYCKAYSIYYSISECVLPISKISYSLKKKDLSKELNLDRIDFHARSPFSALSGRGDEFSSVIDLSRNLRSDIFIDMFSIPIFDIKKKMVPKNSYLLDFFKHGQIVAIERDNRIRSGVSWQTLKTFDLVLQTIVVSLKQRDAEMNDPRDKNVIEGFESASNRFSEYFQNIGSLH